ncbi:Polysaccharide biosynthesis/export protein [Elizabethkingia miricola]|nr:Polysaccharide biosynthesis/export protein [Elizabethkingia miricola]
MNKFILGLTLFSIILLNSCISKKVVYVKDMLPDAEYPVAEAPALRVQKNDRLTIQVSAKSLELAAPFNTVAGSYKVQDDGSVTTGTNQEETSRGYLIDDEGNIAFPVLGNLHVEGLTLEEIRNMVREKLIDGRYISEPIVKVEILNFKVSVMGASGNQVLEVPDGRLTLLEAITKSGGLSAEAAPDKIIVIREENGVRRKIITDIQSQEIFNSPAYYLKQNDIVYIEPNGSKANLKEDRFWKYMGLGTGLIGTITSLLILFKINK